MITQQAPPTFIGRLFNLRQWVCTVFIVSAISLAAVPSNALAAGADGVYKVTGSEGTITIGSDILDIPKKALNKATQGQTAVIVIKKQKIMLNRNATAILLKQIFGKAKFTMNPKVKGPMSLTLVPTEGGYTGKTSTPITSKITVTDEGRKIALTIKTDVAAVVQGGSITLTTTFTASDGTNSVPGKITVTAKR